MSESVTTIHEQIAAVERALAMVREFASAGEGLLGDVPTLRTIAGLESVLRSLSEAKAPANIPPADKLAETRDAIATLKKLEEALRQLILADPSARTGNKYLAEIVTVTQDRTDLKELRANYPDLVKEYTFPIAITKVELRVVDDETGEISARPKRKAE